MNAVGKGISGRRNSSCYIQQVRTRKSYIDKAQRSLVIVPHCCKITRPNAPLRCHKSLYQLEYVRHCDGGPSGLICITDANPRMHLCSRVAMPISSCQRDHPLNWCANKRKYTVSRGRKLRIHDRANLISRWSLARLLIPALLNHPSNGFSLLESVRHRRPTASNDEEDDRAIISPIAVGRFSCANFNSRHGKCVHITLFCVRGRFIGFRRIQSLRSRPPRRARYFACREFVVINDEHEAEICELWEIFIRDHDV